MILILQILRIKIEVLCLCFDDISPKLHANSSSMFILKYSYLVSEGVSVSEVRGEQEARNVIESKSSVSGPVVSEEIIGKASGKFTAHSAPPRNTPGSLLMSWYMLYFVTSKGMKRNYRFLSKIQLHLSIFIYIYYDTNVRDDTRMLQVQFFVNNF